MKHRAETTLDKKEYEKLEQDRKALGLSVASFLRMLVNTYNRSK
jgi:hypothetical protein